MGFLGAGVRAIANSLAGRTGLPMIDVQRVVEARAGCSRGQLVLDAGVGALRDLERAVVEQGLMARPPPVLALGDGAWLSSELRALLKTEAALVYVRRPTAWLLERVRQSCERQPGAIVEYLVGAPETLEPFEALLAEREPAYLAADLHFDADALHPHRVAEALRDVLPLA